MSRSRGSVRRSGDPRKRAAQVSQPDTGRRVRIALASVVAATALAGGAGFLLMPDEERDTAARAHAEAACDLTAKARKAGGADTAARYAAAALLMDRAIIESERAAEADSDFEELDAAVQQVHTAAHEGSPGPWREAVERALAACEE